MLFPTSYDFECESHTHSFYLGSKMNLRLLQEQLYHLLIFILCWEYQYP